MTIFLLAIIFFFIIEMLYFKIAAKFNIIDKPNLRSSHTALTIRGGGIIFAIALIAGVLIFQPSNWYLALGVFLISLISFLDDVLTLNNKVRIGIHVISVALIVFQILINQYDYLYSDFGLQTSDFRLQSIVFLLCSLILTIGIINAYNFMDGINGITVLYSLVAISSLFYIQEYLEINLLDQSVFLVLIASLLVFGFYNLRKKAKSFAGDVGSISIALIVCYLILQLIYKTEDFKWILLLGIYGLDTVATICCRIIRRENIFEAHRSHFYQYLANDKKTPHVWVSCWYAIVQLLLNIVIIRTNNLYAVLFFIAIVLGYILMRLKFEGKQRLFNQY